MIRPPPVTESATAGMRSLTSVAESCMGMALEKRP